MATPEERRIRPSEVRRFGSGRLPYQIPDLTAIQTHAYEAFLQREMPMLKRKDAGLEGVLREIFPIESYDKTIKLGVLTDQSGQFAAFGATILAGNQIKIDEVNKAGGVCGREITLDIKDHGYNVDNAKPRYDEVKDSVLGLLHVLGSPMNTKLLPDYEADHMSVVPVSWASSLLKNPYIVMVGPSYDVEIINGYQYLVDALGVKAGDKVGHIWQEGEYGQNGQTGAKYAAEKLGLTYIDVPIKPTDTDLTTQVNDLLSQGVTAITMTSGPKQTASVVTVLEQAGSTIPVMSSNPGYNTALMEGATGEAMAKHFYLAAAAAPYTSDSEAVKHVVGAFEGDAKYKDVARGFPVNFGYAQAALWVDALTAACESGDLTRDGVHAAFQSIKSYDTGGLVGVLDYSTPGAIPSRENYIAKADPAVAGGLVVVKDAFASDNAKGYTPPA
mgnify:CR=1 FL=1